jgi:hypothetical protein
VRFAIHDAIALLDHRAADRLCQVTFPVPGGPRRARPRVAR